MLARHGTPPPNGGMGYVPRHRRRNMAVVLSLMLGGLAAAGASPRTAGLRFRTHCRQNGTGYHGPTALRMRGHVCYRICFTCCKVRVAGVAKPSTMQSKRSVAKPVELRGEDP